MNTFKTGLLMSLMMGLFLVVGALIGGSTGMAIAFVLAAGLNLFAYWNSDKMLLHMYGARQVDAARPIFITLWNGWPPMRICPCPRFSSRKIRSPMPLPRGAIRSMRRYASPAG